MNEIAQRLNELLTVGTQYIIEASETEIAQKPSPEKWSKKEILGHLIDSGINNLQRFTEIQFEDKPYQLRKYNQDELVKTNKYNDADAEEILSFWLSINERILNVIESFDEATLAYPIKLGKGETSDLAYLVEDYVNHMEHHMNQITA